MPLAIRPYERRDTGSLLRIFQNSVAELGRKAYDPRQTSAWSASAGDADAFCDRLSRGFTVVAERDGKVIAFGQLHPPDVVDMLYCDPGHAGVGVGGRLLAALEARAKDMGQVVIDTKASLVACGFFASHGYQSICEEVVTRNGINIPRHSMRKLLAPPFVSHDGGKFEILTKVGKHDPHCKEGQTP
jgi:putative acetyltransferase